MTSNLFQGMSILQDIQRVIFPYFLRLKSHARCAGSSACIVHVDMTLTRFKVKVKVTRR